MITNLRREVSTHTPLTTHHNDGEDSPQEFKIEDEGEDFPEELTMENLTLVINLRRKVPTPSSHTID